MPVRHATLFTDTGQALAANRSMAAGNPFLGMTLAICCALGIRFAPAGAAELRAFDISNEGNRYSVRLDIVLDIPPDYVRQVLTDYRHIYRLNPSIVDSRILPSPAGGVARVLTRMEGCILFYCSEFTRVEDVRETDTGELVADIVPGMSDFGPGATVWRISRHARGSRLAYESELQPEAFIPPLFGSLLFKQKLRAEILTTLQRIECNAMARRLIAETGDSPPAGNMEDYRLC